MSNADILKQAAIIFVVVFIMVYLMVYTLIKAISL